MSLVLGGGTLPRILHRHKEIKAKYNYHRQKVVWDVIAALVWGGWLSDIACDRIYEVSAVGCKYHQRKDRITYNGHAHPTLGIANL